MVTELEALNIINIIFEKGLPLPEQDIIRRSKDYNEYCIKWSWLGRTAGIATQKTEEEFNLLKRWAECQKN